MQSIMFILQADCKSQPRANGAADVVIPGCSLIRPKCWPEAVASPGPHSLPLTMLHRQYCPAHELGEKLEYHHLKLFKQDLMKLDGRMNNFLISWLSFFFASQPAHWRRTLRRACSFYEVYFLTCCKVQREMSGVKIFGDTSILKM